MIVVAFVQIPKQKVVSVIIFIRYGDCHDHNIYTKENQLIMYFAATIYWLCKHSDMFKNLDSSVFVCQAFNSSLDHKTDVPVFYLQVINTNLSYANGNLSWHWGPWSMCHILLLGFLLQKMITC